METLDWIECCQPCAHGGKRLLLIRPQGGYDIYIEWELPTIRESIEDVHIEDDMTSARIVDMFLEQVEAIPHVTNVEVTGHIWGGAPSIEFSAPLYGRGVIQVDDGVDPRKMLTRMKRERMQDAEGRRISRLGAMTLALCAKTLEEVDLIVDTVMYGGAGIYRNVHYKTNSEGLVITNLDHKGVQMRSDGIEIADLPETVRNAIKGRQRRRLGDVIEIPGFDGLDIAGIGFNAMTTRSTPRDVTGANWIRIDVRNEDGAKFDLVETEEARTIAREIFERRSS